MLVKDNKSKHSGLENEGELTENTARNSRQVNKIPEAWLRGIDEIKNVKERGNKNAEILFIVSYLEQFPSTGGAVRNPLLARVQLIRMRDDWVHSGDRFVWVDKQLFVSSFDILQTQPFVKVLPNINIHVIELDTDHNLFALEDKLLTLECAPQCDGTINTTQRLKELSANIDYVLKNDPTFLKDDFLDKFINIETHKTHYVSGTEDNVRLLISPKRFGR